MRSCGPFVQSRSVFCVSVCWASRCGLGTCEPEESCVRLLDNGPDPPREAAVLKEDTCKPVLKYGMGILQRRECGGDAVFRQLTVDTCFVCQQSNSGVIAGPFVCTRRGCLFAPPPRLTTRRLMFNIVGRLDRCKSAMTAAAPAARLVSCTERSAATGQSCPPSGHLPPKKRV